MAAPSPYVFALAAALLALWIDTRFPKLAPESFMRRVAAVGVALVALEATPVFNGSAAAVYATMFGILLPALVATFLAAVWLLRAVRDAHAGA
jgi:hypothetical protein